MRRLGCLGVAVVLLVGLGGLLDVFAKGYSEGEIAAAVEHRSGGRVGAATVSISSFPFVGRLVGSGDVEHLDIDLHELHITQPVDAVEVHIDGLHMDRDALLGESHIEIKSIERVSVAVRISARRLQALADQIGVSLRFEDGAVLLAGQRLEVSAANGLLTVAGGPIPPLSVPVPAGDADVLPCQPRVAVDRAGIRLSCTSEHIPKLLLDAIGSPALRNQR